MKKLAFYLIFLIPIIAGSSNLPNPGLADKSVRVAINSTAFLLFTADVVGSYIIFNK